MKELLFAFFLVCFIALSFRALVLTFACWFISHNEQRKWFPGVHSGVQMITCRLHKKFIVYAGVDGASLESQKHFVGPFLIFTVYFSENLPSSTPQLVISHEIFQTKCCLRIPLGVLQVFPITSSLILCILTSGDPPDWRSGLIEKDVLRNVTQCQGRQWWWMWIGFCWLRIGAQWGARVLWKAGNFLTSRGTRNFSRTILLHEVCCYVRYVLCVRNELIIGLRAKVAEVD